MHQPFKVGLPFFGHPVQCNFILNQKRNAKSILYAYSILNYILERFLYVNISCPESGLATTWPLPLNREAS